MPALIDITGKKFGKLTVIERDFSKRSKEAMWKCKCECGNEVIVLGGHLRSGHSKSCGCLQKEQAAERMKKIQPQGVATRINDLTNQKFGLLTAIEYSHTNNEKRIWKCQCECGNITYVPSGDLVTRHTSSCGCLKSSQGERKIEKLLFENNITFVKEKTFDGCINIAKLRFDFFVDNKYLIEYDGIQHFKSIDGWGGESRFEEIQKCDEIKNVFCKNNSIPLIRIPYNELDNFTIQDLLLPTTKYRVV